MAESYIHKSFYLPFIYKIQVKSPRLMTMIMSPAILKIRTSSCKQSTECPLKCCFSCFCFFLYIYFLLNPSIFIVLIIVLNVFKYNQLRSVILDISRSSLMPRRMCGPADDASLSFDSAAAPSMCTTWDNSRKM